ncbi:uncharacterized protein B0T23DRAFT_427459 [Neurospora hispaniola]|uniref:Uncharacterized protein n=1 Tax=Neurospora hispaniola TaxID=588809 RepID=A0AAJ0I9M8_9PEZI|nr:hypothetical protein B0T23DRAFT_427459 [Neurospora hispaniola]
MVETRRAKATRLVLDLTEAQSKHAAFIRLPVEVRLMIYKHLWTPTVMPWEYDVVAQRTGQPVNDHMKQIHALASVCRHMRYEVIAEYFFRAQAHVTYAVGGGGGGGSYCGRSDMRVLASMWHLKSSSLFTENLQHVRLNWLPINDWYGWATWDSMVDKTSVRTELSWFAMAALGYGGGSGQQKKRVLRQMNTLKWLASLRSLRTLEILFIDVLNKDNEFVSFYNPEAWRRLLKLPKLEWVALRLFSGRHEEWRNSPEMSSDRERVMDLMDSLVKGPSSMLKKERTVHKIDVRVGAVTAELPLFPAV